MLNITYKDRKTNIWVRERTQAIDIINTVGQGGPAKRWRDDLDKYWSDTIWQRTAQDRINWRRHAEAFAQPRDTTAAQLLLLLLLNFIFRHKCRQLQRPREHIV